jgi:DNA-binding transcriptional MerR regulator
VSNEDLLGIGGFALLSGLSVHALRHYDEVGLLPPAEVDPLTGYRRYRVEQVEAARLICLLRAVDLPIDAVREVLGDPDPAARRAVLAGHREWLLGRVRALSEMARKVDRYVEEGIRMPQLTSPRIVQVTVNVRDLKEARDFYEGVFGAEFREEISSFQFGTWPGEEFFLLTVAYEPGHPGPDGSSRFGLLVSDVDAVHRRALEAGAVELEAPVDRPWKPRSSSLADPSGNRVDLYQA